MANWYKIKSRGNVDDRRSLKPLAVGGVSITAVALMLLTSYLSNGSIETTLRDVAQTVIEEQFQQTQNSSLAEDTSQYTGEDPYEEFVKIVLGSINDIWRQFFSASGKSFTEPKLVLFRQATASGCGIATSQVGPHYCSADQTIYLDETFFDEMASRYGAQGGDVAEAYVIAHEVGHHVQNLLGTLDELSSDDNETSVKLELQADCYAGLWANSIRDEGVFDAGEIREAMDAAAAVGDDRIQEKAQGYSNPETFTHGTAEEREKWFTKGYEEGRVSACDISS
ncbi:MAG TPA: neutral zinc metallopeptidase [bacterium]|nr:neutral zinc metallopeptidase [bacterium]